MDPVTLVGVFASLIQIGDVVHKSIKKLTELKSAYRNVPLVATTLIGQLYIIQVALEHLASIWNSQNFSNHSRYQQVALQMETALESFSPLMLSLQTKLEYIGDDEALLTMKNKALFLWHEREMSDFCALIDRQVNALNLLLQAIQCQTWIEQQQLIERKENQTVLQLARDCSSSIIGVPDYDRESIDTELTDGMSIEFEFDALILSCRPYLSAHRSHLKKVIHSTRPIVGPNDSQSHSHQFASSDLARDESPDQDEVTTIQAAKLAATDRNNPQDPKLLYRALAKAPSIQPGFDFATEHIRLLNAIAVSLNPRLVANSPESSRMTSHGSKRKSSGTLRKTIRLQPQQKQGGHSTDKLILRYESGRHETRTLILGTSGSGKSTLLKGLKCLLEGDYTRQQRWDFRETILCNITASFRGLLGSLECSEQSRTNDCLERHLALLLALRDGLDHLPLETVSAMQALWAEKGFQEHCAQSRDYCARDHNLGYYMQSIERLQLKEYLPSSEDILRTWVRTVRPEEHLFTFNSSIARFFDLGKIRWERKTWIHDFENLNNVYFVVDPAAYGQPLLEFKSAGRMEDQLLMFQALINSVWFTATEFLLVFSKMDLLEQRLSICHPATHFPDFEPTEQQRTPTVDEYMTYLERKFTNLIKSPYHKVNTRILRANLVDMKTLWACRERFDTNAANLL